MNNLMTVGYPSNLKPFTLCGKKTKVYLPDQKARQLNKSRLKFSLARLKQCKKGIISSF